jgi:hypothetical protein
MHMPMPVVEWYWISTFKRSKRATITRRSLPDLLNQDLTHLGNLGNSPMIEPTQPPSPHSDPVLTARGRFWEVSSSTVGTDTHGGLSRTFADGFVRTLWEKLQVTVSASELGPLWVCELFPEISSRLRMRGNYGRFTRLWCNSSIFFENSSELIFFRKFPHWQWQPEKHVEQLRIAPTGRFRVLASVTYQRYYHHDDSESSFKFVTVVLLVRASESRWGQLNFTLNCRNALQLSLISRPTPWPLFRVQA